MPTSPEISLIAAIVNGKDMTAPIEQGISSELFHEYKEVYQWIERYNIKYRRVPSRIAVRKHFPDIRLSREATDIEFFGDEVKQNHIRQSLINIIGGTTDMIADGDVDRALSELKEQVVNIATEVGTLSEIDLIENWDLVYDEVALRKEKYDESGMAGIPSGFPSFDERTGGFQPGQLIVIAARLGEGKSMAMMRMATTAVMEGHRAHFAALEMSKAEVGMRIHNMLSGEVGKSIFNSMNLAQGKVGDLKDYRSFLRTLKDHVKGTLTISDSRRVGEIEVASQLERHKPDIYFFDYLTLAKMGGDGGWKDIGNFTKALKSNAGEHQAAIVVASQLNREAAKSREVAGADALSESDSVGQDADVVITAKQRSRRITEMYCAKNRHGVGGFKWFVHIDMAKGIYKEVTYNEAQDIIDEDKDIEQDERERS